MTEQREHLEVVEDPNDLVGTKLDGRYLVEAQIGAGAMGTVYRCRHTVLGRLVAIKLINPAYASQREAISRFVTEARAASSIGNDHIVDVLDIWQTRQGVAYCVMEYLDGPTLAALIERGPVASEVALTVSIHLARALEAAHSGGITHRDLKPENIFVLDKSGEPFVKIVDFGIAKISRASSRLTQTGTVYGTPHYMSPEQASGKAIDHRTDIYALGVVMYEMLSGAPPFDGETPYAVAAKHMGEPVPSLRDRLQRGHSVPDAWIKLIERCLEKDPESRIKSMQDVLVQLQAMQAAKAARSTAQLSTWSGAAEDGAPRRHSRGKRAVVVGLGLAVLLGLAGAYEWQTGSYGLRERFAPTLVNASGEAAPLATPVYEPQWQPSPPSRGPAAASESPGEAEAATEVDLILFPLESRVYDGDTELGMMPISVEIASGETRTLEVRHFGFKTQRIVLDGSSQRVVVHLRKRDGAPVQRRPGATATLPSVDEGEPTPGEQEGQDLPVETEPPF